MSISEKIIGIDLGTTNSVLAITADGIPTLYAVQGANLLPSVVGLTSSGEMLVGKPAQNQWTAAPERTIRSIKRRMGSDETVAVGDQRYTPQEVSAFILREIKKAAEEHLSTETSSTETSSTEVTRAVITVPAYFNEVQRQATMEAGAIAGLTVERIINEPTAAALAYGFGINDDEHKRILVYDLGGGTFDVSIIELNYGVVDVMATAGDNYLGGDDFDERLAELIAEEFAEAHQTDLHDDPRAWSRLLQASEAAKVELSSEPTATINLEYIVEDTAGNPLHIRRQIDRSEFILRIQDLLDNTITCIQNALSDAQIEPSDIDRVLLVGGSTRIPAVNDLVSAYMGQDPHAEIDPDAAVALGAAVQAGIVAGEEIDSILVDVTPLSLGVRTATTSLSGQILTDRFAPLIRRNTTIPVKKSEMFQTMLPGQDIVQIKVYQGESQIASENVLLGEFMFHDLEPSLDRDDGRSDVHVNFQLDINGILNVTVTDEGSGKQVTEKMKASRQRLSPEEIAASQAKLAIANTPSADTPSADTPDGTIEGVATLSAEGPSASDGSGIDAGTQALLNQAQSIIDDPRADEELKTRVQATVALLRAAAQSNGEDSIEERSDELIDLLMEAEE